jgi:hypothetical protein
MFNEYETFVLVKNIPGETIEEVGSVGVVLIVHRAHPPVYEVEFCDSQGRSVGSKPTFTLSEDYMSRV